MTSSLFIIASIVQLKYVFRSPGTNISSVAIYLIDTIIYNVMQGVIDYCHTLHPEGFERMNE